MKDMSVERFLDESREYIETYGHHKGSLYSMDNFGCDGENPAVCAMGAMEQIRHRWHKEASCAAEFHGTSRVHRAAQDRMDIYAIEQGYDGSAPNMLCPIAQWNDSEATSTEDVLLGFKRVAEGESE